MSNGQKKTGCGGAGGSSGQIQGHPARRENPHGQIQDQLAEFLFQPEDGEVDFEALSSLLDQLEQTDPYPGTLDAEKSLEQFHHQHAAVFDAVRTGRSAELPPPVKEKRGRPSFAKMIVLAAALILLLCTTAQAFNLDVFSAIARWTSEVFSLGGHSASYASVQNNPLEEGETASFDSLEEAVAAFGIDAPIVPKWIPERFELVSVAASNRFSGIFIYADYKCEDGYLHLQYKEVPSQNYETIEWEYGDEAPYLMRDIKHYQIFDNEHWKALWTNGDFECQMHGTISEQELKDMIDSIY